MSLNLSETVLPFRGGLCICQHSHVSVIESPSTNNYYWVILHEGQRPLSPHCSPSHNGHQDSSNFFTRCLGMHVCSAQSEIAGWVPPRS